MDAERIADAHPTHLHVTIRLRHSRCVGDLVFPGAERAGLHPERRRGFGSHLIQRPARSSGHDGGEQALHERCRGEPHRHRTRSQLEGELGAEHGGSQIHEHEHALALRRELIDGRCHRDGISAEDRCPLGVDSRSGRDLHAHSAVVHHLQGKLQCRLPEPCAVGDGDDADHQAVSATAAASVSKRIAVEAAPGSRCPALRSPR